VKEIGAALKERYGEPLMDTIVLTLVSIGTFIAFFKVLLWAFVPPKDDKKL